MVDKNKTLGKQIISFERVAPGILIPLDTGKKSYYRDKLNKCADYDCSETGLCKKYNYHIGGLCGKNGLYCKWNGYGNK